MTVHAKLSASGAHRWMACPGSVKAEEGLPDSSSPFAEEGTQAHDVAEKALTGGWDCSTVWDRDDLAEPLQVYVDYVRAIPHDLRVIEKRVSFGDWVEDGFGTADAICIKDNTIHIVDLKFGKGVKVDATNNPQAMLYALGAFSEYEFLFDLKTVKISIVQPRMDNISEWELPIEDLLKWGEVARQAALATQDSNAKRVPGEKQCRWCKAKATCPALLGMTQDAIMADFDQLDDLPPPNKLTDDQLRVALEAKPLIEAWLSAVENFIKERIVDGVGFPGFKLVEGRSMRKWADEKIMLDVLVNMLGDKAYIKKIVSPAQAEKALGKKRKEEIEEYVVKPRGAPTLAVESDPRPAVTAEAGDFDKFDAEVD